MQRTSAYRPSLPGGSLVLVVLALTWAATYVGKSAGVWLSQTYVDHIHTAVRNVAVEAMSTGRMDLSAISRIASVYPHGNIPNVVKAMQPTPEAIHTIAALHLATMPDLAALRASLPSTLEVDPVLRRTAIARLGSRRIGPFYVSGLPTL